MKQVNVRCHASSVLHDKLIVFGGVRDKALWLAAPMIADALIRLHKNMVYIIYIILLYILKESEDLICVTQKELQKQGKELRFHGRQSQNLG